MNQIKNVTTAFLLVFTISINAQKTIEKHIGEFSELKVYDFIEVELIQSKENKVIISGENKNDVIVNNKNGKLKIKMNLEELFDGAQTKVKLYYTGIDVIDVNEGADLFSEDSIKQFEVELKAQEGAGIKVDVNVDYLMVKAVTGGIISASGSAKSQYISISTGGVYKGADLITDTTEVSINAAGEASVYATKLVEAKVRAGGDIQIYGNPETVNESSVLGGRIKRMD